jgi:hypothetical protein
MTDKITSKILFTALRNKYAGDAVLGEVTMEDEEEACRVRTANVIMYPYYKKWYDKKGLSYDAVLPDDYTPLNKVTVRRIDGLIFESDKTTAVEIKISRSDFFKDTEEKRYAWKKHTDRFAYLVPKGLIKVEEVPEGCGLWEYENGSIVITKRSKINKDVIPFPVSMVRYFAWRAFAAEDKLIKKGLK